MNHLHFYVFLLIAPLLVFALRIILVEFSAVIAVSNYADRLLRFRKLINRLTRNEVPQREINEELVNLLQMI